jgi:hypothetical protein
LQMRRVGEGDVLDVLMEPGTALSAAEQQAALSSGSPRPYCAMLH